MLSILMVGIFRFQMEENPCDRSDRGLGAVVSTRLGAHGGNRTRDLSLTKGVLCH